MRRCDTWHDCAGDVLRYATFVVREISWIVVRTQRRRSDWAGHAPAHRVVVVVASRGDRLSFSRSTTGTPDERCTAARGEHTGRPRAQYIDPTRFRAASARRGRGIIYYSKSPPPAIREHGERSRIFFIMTFVAQQIIFDQVQVNSGQVGHLPR
jgi:hypothetical protein